MTQSPRGLLLLAQQTLSLTSWNIQASQSRPVARSELILDHIFKGLKFPDIILLQEVSSSARKSLLSDPRVRSSFLTTDEGCTIRDHDVALQQTFRLSVAR